MRWILWPLAVLVAVAGMVAIIGWMLPVTHEATESAFVPRPPEQVYSAIANVAAYADWFDGVSRVEVLDAPDGRVRFREHTRDGPIVMEVVAEQPPSRFVTRIADPDQPFGGTWTFDIVPEGSGSRVTITERGEVYNPVFRFMARFVFGYTKTMHTYLASLQRHLR
jgi:uncharacterized protein YndB with AHSA1/START domain